MSCAISSISTAKLTRACSGTLPRWRTTTSTPWQDRLPPSCSASLQGPRRHVRTRSSEWPRRCRRWPRPGTAPPAPPLTTTATPRPTTRSSTKRKKKTCSCDNLPGRQDGRMRAVTVTEPGGPGVLTISELPDPEPGPGEVLIDVAATAVNRADLLQRQGFYPPPPGASGVIGLECSGTVAT